MNQGRHVRPHLWPVVSLFCGLSLSFLGYNCVARHLALWHLCFPSRSPGSTQIVFQIFMGPLFPKTLECIGICASAGPT